MSSEDLRKSLAVAICIGQTKRERICSNSPTIIYLKELKFNMNIIFFWGNFHSFWIFWNIPSQTSPTWILHTGDEVLKEGVLIGLDVQG